METIGIIGAGLAGLTAAAELAAGGRRVCILDKSRGTGGRLATRRTEAGPFDHGAPAAHGDAAFDAAMAAAGSRRRGDGWGATPGMSALVKPFDSGLEIRRGVRVVAAEQRDGWRLRDAEGGDHGPFATLIVAIPAPQAAALLPSPGLDGVTMTPRWTLMAAWDAPVVVPGPVDPFEAVHVSESRIVAHADAGWSAAHLEREGEAVLNALLPGLVEATGSGEPIHAAVHRWRYARTDRPLGRPVLTVSETCFLGGDWTLGPLAGHAWTSGKALARAALGKGAAVA